MSSKHPPTVEYAKKPSVPTPPKPLSREGSYSECAVALCLSCVLLGIIFGLLIGRFV